MLVWKLYEDIVCKTYVDYNLMENVITLLAVLKKVNITKTMLQPYNFSLSWVEQYAKFLSEENLNLATLKFLNLWVNTKRNEWKSSKIRFMLPTLMVSL